MSKEKIEELSDKMEAINGLKRAPSQYQIFLFLLGSGRTLTVKEVANELGMTSKATERAIAKQVDKSLIQRATLRAQSYSCDSKEILLGMLLFLTDINERLSKKGI